MTKLNKILSPAEIHAGENQEQQRAEMRARIEREIRTHASLLRPDGSADVTDPEQQAGRRLPRRMVIQRIQKMNPNLVYEQATNYPDRGGIYFNGARENIVTGEMEQGHWFICGIPHDMVNEFDLRYAVPDTIVDPTVAFHEQHIQKADQRDRGWRSVLLVLVKNGLIELARAEELFHIGQGRSSRNWQEAVN